MDNNIIYLDTISGISGDMFLAAMIDAGIDTDFLNSTFKKIPRLKGITLGADDITVHGIKAKKLVLSLSEKDGVTSRSYEEICRIVSESSLPDRIKKNSLSIFEIIAQAESRVHGKPVDDIHFHEIGGLDSVIDVVGAVAAMERINAVEIIAPPISLNRGFADMAHGSMPLPAPATLRILEGMAVEYNHLLGFENVTPTGAAILKRFCRKQYVSTPAFRLISQGYGAGSYRCREIPNVLRAAIGTPLSVSDGERVVVIETQVDDLTGQIIAYTADRLFAAGALDVYLTPIVMKKGRPGHLFTVIASESDVEKFADILFRETTTIGVRYYYSDRIVMKRETEMVRTGLGDVKIKISGRGGSLIKTAFEYEDCRKIAEKTGMSLADVIRKCEREKLRKGGGCEE